MKSETLPAIIIAVAIAAAGFLAGGRYEIVRSDGNSVARLDRFTGEVSMCIPGSPGGACGFVPAPTPAPSRATTSTRELEPRR